MELEKERECAIDLCADDRLIMYNIAKIPINSGLSQWIYS